MLGGPMAVTVPSRRGLMAKEYLEGFFRPSIHANMCSLMIVCVLLPRFQLTVAAGSRKELLQTPVALAPEPGGVQQVGEVSIAAETFGSIPACAWGRRWHAAPG